MNKHWRAPLCALGIILGSQLFCKTTPAFAATFEVTNTLDSASNGLCEMAGSGDGCTLREAIAAANADANSDVITFARGMNGFITLNSTLPFLTSDMIINGPGARRLSIQREFSSNVLRIFTIKKSGAKTPVVRLAGLTIQDGIATGSSAEENQGGGIANQGGTVIIAECHLTQNNARLGAAIFNSGRLNLVNSTVFNNLVFGGQSAGIYNTGILTINNSTFSFNHGLEDSGNPSVAGALFNAGGTATIYSSTFADNNTQRASAIYNENGTLTLGNTILQRNDFYKAPLLVNSGGTLRSAGHNLSNDNGSGFLNAPGDLINTDPLLGAFEFNGGQTLTYTLQRHSPAFEAGNTNLAPLPAFDQRGVGFPRVRNSQLDIGAFEVGDEFQNNAGFMVNSNDDSNDGICGVAHCSLREAILSANITRDIQGYTERIIFAPDLTAINITSALPSIFGRVEIRGSGPENLIIRRAASGNFRIFTLGFKGPPSDSPTDAIISGLTITNGSTGRQSFDYSVVGGGVCLMAGVLTLDNCVVTGNEAYIGGGIANVSGNINITNCTIRGNQAEVGGALHHEGSFSQLSNSLLSENTAEIGGGVRTNNFGSLNITNCTFNNNQALYDAESEFSGFGGGIANAGNVAVRSCTFTNNRADRNGSSISNDFGSNGCTLSNTVLQHGVAQSPVSHLFSFGIVTSKGYNLSDDDGSGFLNQTGDQINTNAGLGPLQDNGGATLTHALSRQSPAYNAGDPDYASYPAPIPFDQRGQGFARIVEGRVDIGAFERQAPTITINDITVTEGNRGTPDAVFTVTLSEASPSEVRVRYVTQGRTTHDTNDYTHLDEQLIIPAGRTSGTIKVPITNDTIDEDDEVLHVILYLPEGATIADNIGAATIIDDDRPPSFSISDVTVGENGQAQFSITLSAPSQRIVSVYAFTRDGTARASSDYKAVARRFMFWRGETTKVFEVPIGSDGRDEPDEIFYMLLAEPVNASLGRGRGACTILDDDNAPSVNVEDAGIIEGSNGPRALRFRLTLSQPSGYGAKVTCSTSVPTNANAATPGVDYQALAPTEVIFPADVGIAYVSVLVNGDLQSELDETFLLNLSQPVNATIGDGQGIGTIINDERPPALSISDVSIAEGQSGMAEATFTVSLSSPSAHMISVNYATADGVARSTSDYVAQNGTLTFSPGQTSKTINVPVNGDTALEADESFFVFLSGALNASIGRARGMGVVLNDDLSN